MHLALIAIAAVIVVAAFAYFRRHAAVAQRIEADAAKLKTAAETEAKKIEVAVEGDVKKVEAAL